MVDKVEITQEQENAPTLEEQAKQQEEKQEAPQQVTSNEERPSWLPDKFSNAEELAKAYGALETKLSQRQEVKQEEKTDMKIQEPQEPESKPGQFDKYYDEFIENNQLSEKSYEELDAMGLSKDLVDAYNAGKKALADNDESEVSNTKLLFLITSIRGLTLDSSCPDPPLPAVILRTVGGSDKTS